MKNIRKHEDIKLLTEKEKNYFMSGPNYDINKYL